MFEETPARIILLPSSILMMFELIRVLDFPKLKFILKAFCDDNKSLQAMSAELLTEIFLRRRCKLPCACASCGNIFCLRLIALIGFGIGNTRGMKCRQRDNYFQHEGRAS